MTKITNINGKLSAIYDLCKWLWSALYGIYTRQMGNIPKFRLELR